MPRRIPDLTSSFEFMKEKEMNGNEVIRIECEIQGNYMTVDCHRRDLEWYHNLIKDGGGIILSERETKNVRA